MLKRTNDTHSCRHTEPKEVNARGQKLWRMSELQEAKAMWLNGDTAATIAERFGVSVKSIYHLTDANRHHFPKRRVRIDRRQGGVCKQSFDLATDISKELNEVAKKKGVSKNILIRNAIMFAREKGFPILDPDAGMSPSIYEVGRKYQAKRNLVPFVGKDDKEQQLGKRK